MLYDIGFMKTIYKIFLLCGLLICVSSVMNAQRIRKRFTSDIHFGLNLATMDIENGNMYKKLKPGVHIGVNFNYKVLGNMQLQTGLYVTKKGLKQHVKDRQENWAGTILAEDTIRNLTANYIQVPLAVGYEVYLSNNFAFNINVGMYAAYGFKGKYREESSYWTKTENNPPTNTVYRPEIEKDTYRYDMLKRLDYGAIGSVGLIYDIYTLNFTYEYGLYDVSNDVARNLKTRNMAVSLGFRF